MDLDWDSRREDRMAKSGCTAWQRIIKLGEAEFRRAQGKTVGQGCKQIRVTERVGCRWRKEYGGRMRSPGSMACWPPVPEAILLRKQAEDSSPWVGPLMVSALTQRPVPHMRSGQRENGALSSTVGRAAASAPRPGRAAVPYGRPPIPVPLSGRRVP